jgi:adenylate cyclase
LRNNKPVVTTQSTPHLVLFTASGNQHLPLREGNCWTVGRGDDNDFVITDRWISRNHTMFQMMDSGEMYLIDLGSLNGRRVSIPVTLRDGDRLTFGQTELVFHHPRSEPDIMALRNVQDFTATATLHVRRMISVLVVDIRDYTVLTRKMDEKILSEMIGQWFRQAGEIIRNNGSWVDKYIGDAVMAVWIHRSQEAVAGEELLPTMRVVRDLHAMTNDLTSRFDVPFPLRIGAGINTGFAMVGNTGSGDRPDYTALGDTVNASFRLESATKQLGMDVAIGETTYSSILSLGSGESNCFQKRTVELKGYDVPTNAYACDFAELKAFLEKQGV